MTEDRPYLGILLMLGFCLLAPLSDTIAKVLIARLSLGQLVTVRFGVMALILVPLVTAMGGLAALRLPRRVLGLTILRSALHLAGTACFFGALLYLPIADALAIVFVLPFLMLLAGRYFLNEEVGARRLIAEPDVGERPVGSVREQVFSLDRDPPPGNRPRRLEGGDVWLGHALAAPRRLRRGRWATRHGQHRSSPLRHQPADDTVVFVQQEDLSVGSGAETHVGP